MTKEEKDKILKALAEDRNDFARDCERRTAIENGKVMGADYMMQRFLDILKTEVEPSEPESESKRYQEIAKSYVQGLRAGLEEGDVQRAIDKCNEEK